MKKLVLSTLLQLLACNYFFSQTIRTVGTSGNYSTLSAAFADINNGLISGQIELQLISSFTEISTATLNASGTGSSSYSSVLIFPTVAGVQVSGSLAGGLLVLDGADNVTIDGRVNQSGGVNLVLQNTASNSVLDNNTIRLQNSSENNVFRYTIMKGSNPFHSDAAGINPSGSIFRFAGSTSGNGNDNNLIEFCQFTTAGTVRPSSAIFSEGSANFENSENQIKNSDFYDHLKLNPLDRTSASICVYSNSTNFTIQGNSFYETSSFGVQSGTPTTNGYSYIFVRNFPSGYVTIKDNFIGGSAPNCAGNPLFFTSSNSFPKNYNLRGINVIAGNTNLSLIENNTIKNITMEKTNYQSFGQFVGISIQSGWCNVLNNNIGSQNETSIILDNASTSSLSNSRSSGIEYRSCVPQDCHVSGNNISGIICKRTGDPIYNHSFYGIEVTAGCSTPGNVFIRNNQIGSPNIANAIICEPLGGDAAILKQELLGIFSNINSKSVFIDSNRIENLINLTTASSGVSVTGIQCLSAFSTFSVNNNLINNLTTYSSFVWDGTPTLMRLKPISGIFVWQSQTPVGPKTQYFRNNSISNLKNLNTSNFSADVVGIYLWGKNASDVVTNYIEKNYVSNLFVAPENTNSATKLTGIFIDNAGISSTNNIPNNVNFTNNINNNVITIGQSDFNDREVYGIYDGNINGNVNNFNFNTIVIGGNSPSGSSSKTYCYYRSPSTNSIANFPGTKSFVNNIFYNERVLTGGANSLHFSTGLFSLTGLTINYNDHWVTNTGSGNFLAQLGTTNYSSLTNWQTAIAQESNSINLNPDFINSTGNTVVSFRKNTTLNGINNPTILTDILEDARNNPPQMGAIENNIPCGLITISTDSIQSVSCFNGNNGYTELSASGGTAPYSYSWSNNQSGNIQNSLSAGTYTITVSDAQGCTETATIQISEPDSLIVSVNSISPEYCAQQNGSASILVSGGTGPYTYIWSNGNNSFSSTTLSAGTYDITVTDENGCVNTFSFDVNAQVGPQIDSTQIQDAICVPLASGEINVFASGGTGALVYNLGNQQIQPTNSFLNLPAGQYVVYVTDNQNCNDSVLVTIGAVQSPSISNINVTNISCAGLTDGLISFTATNGEAPYQFQLNGGTAQSVGEFEGLSEGTYSLIVTDVNNCLSDTSIIVTEPNPLVVSLGNDVSTCNGNNIELVGTISGGNEPYTILWNNGVTTVSQIVSVSVNTPFSMTVTDNNACGETASILVSIEPCFNIPGGLSPNNDNVNDTWEVTGLADYPNAKIWVFDRWGQQVYEGTNTSNPWNGKFNDKDLPTADYYYIIELGNGQNYNGVVTLKR
jgi:gliding motility-associated-like protein